MIALTIWQPWCWGIAAGLKPVENRVWAPPARAIGAPLAIHASKRKLTTGDSEEALAFQLLVRIPEVGLRFRGERWPTWRELPLGAVCAVVTLAGAVHESGRVLGPISVERAAAIRRDPFWVGPWGWVLDDVQALLEPVPCRGAQGLWTLPANVEAAVRAAWRRP